MDLFSIIVISLILGLCVYSFKKHKPLTIAFGISQVGGLLSIGIDDGGYHLHIFAMIVSMFYLLRYNSTYKIIGLLYILRVASLEFGMNTEYMDYARYSQEIILIIQIALWISVLRGGGDASRYTNNNHHRSGYSNQLTRLYIPTNEYCTETHEMSSKEKIVKLVKYVLLGLLLIMPMTASSINII